MGTARCHGIAQTRICAADRERQMIDWSPDKTLLPFSTHLLAPQAVTIRRSIRKHVGHPMLA